MSELPVCSKAIVSLFYKTLEPPRLGYRDIHFIIHKIDFYFSFLCFFPYVFLSILLLIFLPSESNGAVSPHSGSGMFKSSLKSFFAVALPTASLAEAGEGSHGPDVKRAGSFKKRPNNIGCDLGNSHNLCGFLFIVYNMRIIIFGCLYSVSSKAKCSCIFPLICSFYSFISSLY